MAADKRSTVDRLEDAYRLFRHVKLNGVTFEVAPNRAVSVMKAAGRKYQGMRYKYDTWMRLNDQYSLHLGRMYDKRDICKGAGMEVFDVAVPQPWLDQPENLKRWKSGNWAVWSYDGKNRTFGAPVWSTEVFRVLKKNLLRAMRG